MIVTALCRNLRQGSNCFPIMGITITIAKAALERAAATAAEPAAAESSSAEAAATPSRTGAAGAWSSHERLVRVHGHGVHRAGEEDGIEPHVRRRAHVPVGRVLHDPLER